MAPAEQHSPGYSRLRLTLHWLVVAFVTMQYLFQNVMRTSFESLDAGEPISAGGFLVTTWHTLAGIGIGLLVLWRRRLARTHPIPVAAGLLTSRPAAVVALQHRLIDGLLLWMVASGAAHYYFGWAVAGKAHEIGKWVLVAVLALHVGAALWHHLWRNDPVLRRMVGKARPADTIDARGKSDRMH